MIRVDKGIVLSDEQMGELGLSLDDWRAYIYRRYDQENALEVCSAQLDRVSASVWRVSFPQEYAFFYGSLLEVLALVADTCQHPELGPRGRAVVEGNVKPKALSFVANISQAEIDDFLEGI